MKLCTCLKCGGVFEDPHPSPDQPEYPHSMNIRPLERFKDEIDSEGAGLTWSGVAPCALLMPIYPMRLANQKLKKYMALKNYRVIARKTTYFYLDVVSSRLDNAVEQGWAKPEQEFKPLPDPQNEWKIIDAVLMDKDEGPDELRYLLKS